MIKLMILGNLGKDAEVKTFQGNEKGVINFSVAHTENFTKDGVKQSSTTWVECQWWLKNEILSKVAQYLKKGKKVYLEGKPTSRAYLSGSEAKSSLSVIIDRLEFAEPANSGENKPNDVAPVQVQPQQPASSQGSFAPPSSSGDDDLPF